jgi:hypothetical protein
MNVTLKNEPYELCTWYTYGNYIIAETLVNGKSNWKDPTYDAAIWYVSNGNYWTIGSYVSNGNYWTIGSFLHWKGLGDFYALNDFSGLTDSGNQWHFKDLQGNWKIPSDPNDIQVNCIN